MNISRPWKLASGLVGVIVICLAALVYFSIIPRDFAPGTTVVIEKDMSLSEAADLLKSKNVIRSAFMYKAYSMMSGGRVIAGTYLFEEPRSAVGVAYRTATGSFGIPKIKITFPEGFSASEMAELLKKNMPNFDSESFLSLARPKEGYLFPDTYFFYPSVTPTEVITELEETFKRKILPLKDMMVAFGRAQGDIIKMASILEKEAANSEDRRIIAGILWKRMDKKMPLGVDAAFYYLLHKTSAELTSKDLNMDSPYNTYKYAGLPPTAISNPGLAAIEDTISPILTDYFYYLSDKEGNMHYANDLAGHAANKAKYLK